MTVRRFGRQVFFDERSRAFPTRTLTATKKPRSYTWACPLFLDQGTEGACTGFAVAHEAAARPVCVHGITHETARSVYHRARQLDNLPGEDYDGSTVLGAVKAGRELGWYKEFRWAFGIEDLKVAVSHLGPAILGIPWYEGMTEPDARGYMRVTGAVEGGHAILCTGYNVRADYFLLHNSWGTWWGKQGRARISAADLSRLLKEQGEACIPVVRGLGL